MKDEFKLENFRDFVANCDGKRLQTLLNLFSEEDEFTDRQFGVLLREMMALFAYSHRKAANDAILSSGE